MSGCKRANGRFIRGAALSAAIAWMGLIGGTAGLMQTVCLPTPPAPPEPTPITVSLTASPGTTIDTNTVATLSSAVQNATGTVSYSWDFTGVGGLGGAPAAASRSFVSSVAGIALATVTATDSGSGTIASASVTITVQTPAPPVPPAAPVANAGADQTVEIGQVVSLAGSATDGQPPLAYSWVQISGPAQTLGGASSATASVTGVSAGTAVFELTVTDTLGRGSMDTVTVTVTSPTGTDVGTTFTLDVDNLTGGTAGDDIFSAPLLFDTGALRQSLQTGDRANGLAGTDVLNAALLENTAPILADIEIFNLSNFAGGNVNLTANNITGMTAVNSIDSDGKITVLNAKAVVDMGLDNTTQDLEITYIASAVLGDNEADLTLADVDGSTVTADGVETVNVASGGSAANNVTLALGGLETLNVTGDQDLDVGGAFPGTFQTLGAGTFAGGLTITMPNADDDALTVNTGSGDDVVDVSADAADEITASLGAGDDQLTVAALEEGTGTYDGGDGDDEIVTTTAVTAAVMTAGDVLTNVTNFEGLTVSDAIANDIELALFNLSSRLTAAAGISSAAQRTITVASGDEIVLQADTAAGAAASHIVKIAGNGLADTVSLLMEDADFAEVLVLDGIEIANLSATDDSTTFANLQMTPSDPPGPTIGTTTLNISGEEDVTLTSATVQTINAATLTGDLTAVVTGEATVTGGSGGDTLTGTGANEVSFTGGAGEDELTGSTAGDALNGGDDDDTINGLAGIDALSGGAGADTFVFQASSSPANGTTFDTISDFEVGTDIIDYTAALVIADVAAPPAVAGTAAINATGVASFHADDDTLAERITAVEAAIDAGANANGTSAVFEFSGATYLFISNGVSGVAAADTVIELSGVTGVTEIEIDANDNVILN